MNKIKCTDHQQQPQLLQEQLDQHQPEGQGLDWQHQQEEHGPGPGLSPGPVSLDEPHPQLGPWSWPWPWPSSASSWQATVKTRRARPLLCVASCASDVAEPRLPVIGQCYGSGVLVLRPRSTRHQQCYRRDEATFFPAFKHVRTYF